MSGPVVLTVHDVSFVAHPEWFSWREGLRRRVMTRASARRAARVLTQSDFTKREAVRYLGLDQSRVDVIYLGTTTLPTQATREPLVLYVGSLFNRRHVPELIEGFAQLAATHPHGPARDRRRQPHDAGRSTWTPSSRGPACADRIPARQYVSDAELSRSTRARRRLRFCPSTRASGSRRSKRWRPDSGRRARHGGRTGDLRPGGRVRRAAGARPDRRGARARARRRRRAHAPRSRPEQRRSSAIRGTNARVARCRCCWRARNDARHAPRLAIVIVTYNSARDIDVALRSLTEPRAGHPARDRSSSTTPRLTDTATRLRARQWPGVRLIESPTQSGIRRREQSRHSRVLFRARAAAESRHECSAGSHRSAGGASRRPARRGDRRTADRGRRRTRRAVLRRDDRAAGGAAAEGARRSATTGVCGRSSRLSIA